MFFGAELASAMLPKRMAAGVVSKSGDRFPYALKPP
jgi:hypothetical protein